MKVPTHPCLVKRAKRFLCSRQRELRKAGKANRQHTQGKGDRRGPNVMGGRLRLNHGGKPRNTPQGLS